jgi:hypothetical protein
LREMIPWDGYSYSIRNDPREQTGESSYAGVLWNFAPLATLQYDRILV